MLPSLIEDRTFTANNVDVNNPKAVDAFMRDVFDTLSNKGKASLTNVNYANKFSKQRVLHIKPESLIGINEKYEADRFRTQSSVSWQTVRAW